MNTTFNDAAVILANAMGSAVLLLLMITNGFAILRTAIPSYLINGPKLDRVFR